MSTVEPVAGLRKQYRLPRPGLGIGPGTVSLLAGAVAWEVIGQVAQFKFFPPLSAVLIRLAEMITAGQIFANLGASLTNLAIGFAISLVVGVGVGALMGAYPRIEGALDIYVYALLTAPSLVFAPIFFALFGIGRESIVAIVVMYAIFIMIINTSAAIRSVPAPLIEMGKSFCASDRQLFFRIMLPAATPLIMAGIRLGAGRAVKGMINGEMFIAVVGLGAVVMSAGRRFDSETVLAVLIVITVVAMALIQVVQLIDHRLTSWLPATSRVKGGA